MFLKRCVAIKIAVCKVANNLSTFSTDSSGQLDILWHDGDTFGVDGAQVGIFEETDEVSFRCFLKGHDGRALETQVSLEVLGDFTDQSLEGQFSDKQFSRFLVSSDLTKGYSTWSVSVWFLHSSGCWGAFPGSLGSQLFSWSFSTGRFTCSLLGTSHFSFLRMSLATERQYELRKFKCCRITLQFVYIYFERSDWS